MSGNPNGRPKRLPITDALMEKLEKKADAVAAVLLKMALAGDIRAITEVLDRTEGKPKQRIEQSGPNGGPIPFELPGTREEIERRIAELEQKNKGGSDAA